MFNQKEYAKQYYIDNKDKLSEQHKQWLIDNSEHMKEYREKHKEHKKKYDKEWKKKNKEHIKKGRKEYYKKNQEKEKKTAKEYYKSNPEYVKQYCIKNREKRRKRNREWRKYNIEKCKEYRNKYNGSKYHSDLKYNLTNKISKAIKKSLKKNSKASICWEMFIGYTLIDLTKHLTKTMPEGYAWKDYLEGKLHVDHKIPISVFNFDKPENPDFKKCWALKNLRLLPAKENLIKGNKLTRPFQPALKLNFKVL